MSPPSISCRLCLSLCNDHRTLFEEDGSRNELYTLMEKYFVPWLLNMASVDQTTVICTECWYQMIEFNAFQQSVLRAHKNVMAKQRYETAARELNIESTKSTTNNKVDIDICDQDNFSTTLTQDRVENSDIELLPNDEDDDDDELVMAKQRYETAARELNIESTKSTTNNKVDVDICDQDNFSSTITQDRVENSDIELLPNGEDDDDDEPVMAKQRYETAARELNIESTKSTTNNKVDDDICDQDDFSSTLTQDRVENSDIELLPNDEDDDDDEPVHQTEAFVKSEVEYLEYDFTKVSTHKLANGSCVAESQEADEWQQFGDPIYTDFKQPQTAFECDDLIAQWRPNLECVVCGVTCSSFSVLQQHFAEQHPNEQCHITCCEQKFCERPEIERHIHFHFEPLPYRCDSCFKSFSTVYHFEQHLQSSHSEKPRELFACSKCAMRCKSKNALTKHLRFFCQTKTPTHACTECGKLFKSLKVFERHTEMCRLGSRSRNATNVKCTICDKLFTSPRQLRDHMANHRGKYSCFFCPTKYELRKAFYDHVRRKHRKEWTQYKMDKKRPKKVHHCSTCSKSYGNRFALREHQATHAGKPLYSCKLCAKNFYYSTSLGSHMKRKHCGEQQQPEKKEMA